MAHALIWSNELQERGKTTFNNCWCTLVGTTSRWKSCEHKKSNDNLSVSFVDIQDVYKYLPTSSESVIFACICGSN